MLVEFRHLERSPFNEFALRQVVKTYARTKLPVVVSFDMQIRLLGLYVFLPEKNKHYVRVSVKNHEGQGIDLEYDYMDTLLHELRHAQQRESLGKAFDNEKHHANPHVSDAVAATWYSPVEIDARVYADANVVSAMKLYTRIKNDKTSLVLRNQRPARVRLPF